MGYAYYIIGGKECGYAVPDVCNQDGCEVAIHRGVAYACGGNPGDGEDYCDRYFCDSHLLFTDSGVRCSECAAFIEQDDAEARFDYDNV